MTFDIDDEREVELRQLRYENLGFKKQSNSYKLLVESLEGQLTYHRNRSDMYKVAIDTLQSERDMNTLLTNENMLLHEEIERLRWSLEEKD